MNIPKELSYALTHEWIHQHASGTVTIGITDYAQSSLGDITFVQLPKVGTLLRAKESFGVIESVKAASDVYAPLTGTVMAINDQVTTTPELLNQSPYEQAWLLKLHPTDPTELRRLLTWHQYHDHVR